MKNCHLSFLCLGVTVAVGGALDARNVRAAGAPQTEALFYAGTLEASDGSLVDDDLLIFVKIFDAASGGRELCQTLPSGMIAVRAGRFRFPLSAQCVTAVRDNRDTWVEVSVSGTVFPRSKIGAVPYAIRSGEGRSSGGVFRGRRRDRY